MTIVFLENNDRSLVGNKQSAPASNAFPTATSASSFLRWGNWSPPQIIRDLWRKPSEKVYVATVRYWIFRIRGLRIFENSDGSWILFAIWFAFLSRIHCLKSWNICFDRILSGVLGIPLEKKTDACGGFRLILLWDFNVCWAVELEPVFIKIFSRYKCI